VSRLPDFAHGALYVFWGLSAWSLVDSFKVSYPLAILISLCASSILGAVIYRVVPIRLRGLSTSEIIASFAVGLIILEGFRLQGIGGFKGFIGPFYVLPSFIDARIKLAGRELSNPIQGRSSLRIERSRAFSPTGLPILERRRSRVRDQEPDGIL